MTANGWGSVPMAVLIAVLAAAAAHAVLTRILKAGGDAGGLRQAAVRHFRGPSRLVFLLMALAVVYPGLHLPGGAQAVVVEVTDLALIATVGWLLTAGIGMLRDLARARYAAAGSDDLLVRALHTRVDVVGKVVTVFVVIVTAAAMLMTIPGVRALGTSILASAGLVGIVAGLAAQPLLTNLFAGLQLAVTQPLRLNDVVVMSAPTSPASPYWGTVEEITAAYVVIRVWDLRRLIVPLSYILQNPFENWTYRTANLLGYVVVYADYRVDVDAMRDEVQRILQASPWWDRTVWNVQVTTVSEATIGVRVLFSAADSNARWNLIVEMQEKLVRYLADRHPEHLPRVRVETPGAADGVR